MNIHAKNVQFASWLSLIRLPNLLTVPGDPIAGFLLASAALFPGTCLPSGAGVGWISGWEWGRAAAAVLVALLLYMHGLIQNDWFDIREDHSLRPHRPLPSGNVGLRMARMVCIVLAITAIAMAGLIGRDTVLLAAALTAAVFLYNGILKNHRLLGPLSMGLCRALSLLLGAAAAGGGTRLAAAPVLAAAALLGLYVAAVTLVAVGETQATALGFRRWGPAVVLAVGFGLIGWTAFDAGLAAWPYALVLGWPMSLWAGFVGYRLGAYTQPERIQASVVRWLRGLLFLQFVLAAIGWGCLVVPGVMFLLFWLLHGRLAARYACT